MIERVIEADRLETVINVFGSFDRNVGIIESELNVSVLSRDGRIVISGDAENVFNAEKALGALLYLASRGEIIDTQKVRYIISLAKDDKTDLVYEMVDDVICVTAKGKPVKAKTVGQNQYCSAIANNTNRNGFQ